MPALPAPPQPGAPAAPLCEAPDLPRRYRVDREIARGGMGSIHLVYDGELRRHLALKVLLQGASADRASGSKAVDPKSRGRFIEEAQVTAQLDHPGIVPVHDLGVDAAGRAYFTLKLVKGDDLREIFEKVRARDERWSQTRALGVIQRVCEAVAYAHDKGVIHRDLKPANIMVGRFGEVYVMDWGLARVLDQPDRHDLRLREEKATVHIHSGRRERARREPDAPLETMDGDVIGTPAYMSPEQAGGRIAELSRAADVYSVGAMLYELLGGRRPYALAGDRVTPYEILARVRAAPPEPLATIDPSLPAELVAICEKAMARDPRQRYPDTRDLGEDLAAFLEHRVVSAYRTGPLIELRKWIDRNRALAATLAAAFVLTLGGAAGIAVVAERGREAEAAAKREVERKNVDLAAAEVMARAAQATAEEQLEEITRLSDLTLLAELEAAEPGLWPARSWQVAAMDRWIDNVRVLGGRLPLHATDLARLREQGEEKPSSSLGGGGLPTWTFAERTLQWRHDNLARLVAGIGRMVGAGEESLLAQVERRRERARETRARTVDGYEKEWAEAITAIALADVYGGFELGEIEGLVPIGPDPKSGLWEFWHVESGTRPERDATTDKSTDELRPNEESGIVLVLIPGTTTWIGSQATDPAQPYYDPLHQPNEILHQVTLAPYFLSKYEMTQGQWLRLTGVNPSDQRISTALKLTAVLSHPVQLVDWEMCSHVLGRYDLALPTEEQWENGARGGTSTPWWTGADARSLAGASNLADHSYTRVFRDGRRTEDFDDGHAAQAPVGSFRSNPFGLHDMTGNVAEWCADWYQAPLPVGEPSANAPLGAAPQEPDPEAGGKPARGTRVMRNGTFLETAFSARAAYRNYDDPSYRFAAVGVRPGRKATD